MERLASPAADETDARIAARLRALRLGAGWSLVDLAARSGVSRATLSRIETGATSATAAVLGRLSAAHGLSLTRLVEGAEATAPARMSRAEQPVWTDPETGFRRRAVSPPAPHLAAEAIEGRLPPGRALAYPGPARPGLEHHLLLLEGALSVTVAGTRHALAAGDCLRYRLDGPSRFETGAEAARYVLFTV